MYYEYYGFQDKPFNQTPDPRFIFLSENHREAIAHLLYGINSHVGFISLTGEVGAGKTTVLRSLLSHLDADRYRTALIFNPALSPARLLRNIAREFGILPDAHGEAEVDILDRLNDFLIRENAEKRTVVLVIDEAQNLKADVLEQIRLISNLETDSDKLIQIILAGQPELLDLLKKRNLRQLNQRITVRYHLKPLDFKDTEDYINHRVEIAKGRVFFSGRAVAQIFRYSGGLPRLINAAADRALLAGYTQNTKKITGHIAAIATRDLARQKSGFILTRPIILYPIILIGIMLAVAPFFWNRTVLSGAFPGAFKDSTKTAFPKTAATAPVLPLNSGQHSVSAFPVPLPEAQINEKPVNLNRGFWSGLEKLSENESLRLAADEAALFWKVEPVPKEELDFKHLQIYLQTRGLSLLHVTGKLSDLKQINRPAVLEFFFPGKVGKRYAALIGFKGEKMAFGARHPSEAFLTVPDFERYWTGHAYIPWKNFLELPERLAPGSRGKHVGKLQKLLRETGIHIPELTRIYDGKTRDDVKIFQASYGLEPNGIVDAQTLLTLYGSIERFATPRLKQMEQP